MADTKVTTGYAVEPRTANSGERIYAVMRQYLYRGKPGTQLVTIYRDQAIAESVRGTLNLHKNKEV
jgi:hypothetical protein